MKKIVSIFLIVVALALVVSPAEAGNRRHRGGNSIEITKVCNTEVNQRNVSSISNSVVVVGNTGDNEANKNAKGTVNMTTGNVSSTVTITNISGGNFAQVSGCCCGGCGNVCGEGETACQL